MVLSLLAKVLNDSSRIPGGHPQLFKEWVLEVDIRSDNSDLEQAARVKWTERHSTAIGKVKNWDIGTVQVHSGCEPGIKWVSPVAPSGCVAMFQQKWNASLGERAGHCLEQLTYQAHRWMGSDDLLHMVEGPHFTPWALYIPSKARPRINAGNELLLRPINAQFPRGSISNGPQYQEHLWCSHRHVWKGPLSSDKHNPLPPKGWLWTCVHTSVYFKCLLKMHLHWPYKGGPQATGLVLLGVGLRPVLQVVLWKASYGKNSSQLRWLIPLHCDTAASLVGRRDTHRKRKSYIIYHPAVGKHVKEQHNGYNTDVNCLDDSRGY